MTNKTQLRNRCFSWFFGHRTVACILLAVTCVFVSADISANDLGLVTINRFDGTTLTGTISEIDQNGNLTGPNLPAGLNLADILSIESDRAIQRRDVYGVTIQLSSGSQLLVRDPEITDQKVVFRSGCELAEIPLQTLRAIVWRSSPEIERRIASPSADKDAVLVATNDGERGIEGVVEAMNREQLQVNYQNESRKIGVQKINGIVMANLGLESPSGSTATIELTDGSQLIGVVSSMTEGQLQLALAGNSLINVPAAKIKSIHIQSDRQRFLSDLQPLSVEQKTEFTVERQWRRDRSIENNPLSIRYGKSDRVIEFNKGLGTQAFTKLVFENADGFDRFRAIVGIDAETEGRGDCQMVVRGDGIELWSFRVRGVGEPLELDIDITGMKQISLLVYPGADFDLADHADWGNARLIRTK